MNTPQLSVVIPVYNEEQGLQSLFDRLYPALDAIVDPMVSFSEHAFCDHHN